MAHDAWLEPADSLDKNFDAVQGFATEAASWQIFVAIPISLMGASLTVIGMMVQKSAHQAAAKKETAEEDSGAPPTWFSKFYAENGLWLGGLAIFGFGNLVTWVALGLAPNGVLACFNSWNIVFSMVIAPMWLGERVPERAKKAALLLVLGCVWVTCAGPRSYRLETISGINFLFAQYPFTICSSVLLTLLVAMYMRQSLWKHFGLWTPCEGLQTSLAAAIFASYAVLFSKCTSMLVSGSVISQNSAWARWQFFLWAGGSLACGFCQIFFLNESLKRGKASYVIPVYESLSMSLQIVLGGVFFREYANFSVERHLLFWPGVAIVLLGIILVTQAVEEDDDNKAVAEAPTEAPPEVPIASS